MYRLLLVSLLAFAACSTSSTIAAERKPNFLILFSDDAGYADFGFQPECSPEMAAVTPRLTKLATEGIRFTNAYVSGCVCSPSRAGISTGRYQERFGHDMNIPPGYMKGGLPLTEKFIGDHLRPQGYATGLIGKWHLGYPADYHPNQRGYDLFHGFLQGARNYYPYEGNRKPPHQLFQRNGEFLPEDGYSTDRIGDAACEFIKEHHEDPFYLFVSFNAVHGPLQARKSDLPNLAHIEEQKHRQYVGMMLALDQNIAKILDALDEQKLAEDTLVLFTNDNGGQTGLTASNAPLRGKKGQLWEGGTRVPMLIRWPGVAEVGRVCEDPIITLDMLPTYLAACDGQPLEGVKLDGTNLLPLLKGETPSLAERPLFWRSNGPHGPISIRQGDWKLIHIRNEKNSQPELYNVREDIAEEHNLAAKHPDRVATLARLLQEWESELVDPLWGNGPGKDATETPRKRRKAKQTD